MDLVLSSRAPTTIRFQLARLCWRPFEAPEIVVRRAALMDLLLMEVEALLLASITDQA